MTKDELLKELVNEYHGKLRRPEDISLSDFRKAFLAETGLKIGDKKARTLLDSQVASGEFVFLTVINHNGHDVQVWRRVKPKKKKAGK